MIQENHLEQGCFELSRGNDGEVLLIGPTHSLLINYVYYCIKLAGYMEDLFFVKYSRSCIPA